MSPKPLSSQSRGSTPGGGIDSSSRNALLRANSTASSYSNPSRPPSRDIAGRRRVSGHHSKNPRRDESAQRRDKSSPSIPGSEPSRQRENRRWPGEAGGCAARTAHTTGRRSVIGPKSWTELGIGDPLEDSAVGHREWNCAAGDHPEQFLRRQALRMPARSPGRAPSRADLQGRAQARELEVDLSAAKIVQLQPDHLARRRRDSPRPTRPGRSAPTGCRADSPPKNARPRDPPGPFRGPRSIRRCVSISTQLIFAPIRAARCRSWDSWSPS